MWRDDVDYSLILYSARARRETVAAHFIALTFGGLLLWIMWAASAALSINWTVAGQNIANGVITAMDPNGQIKIRGGVNKTHVVIDRIGWFI